MEGEMGRVVRGIQGFDRRSLGMLMGCEFSDMKLQLD
jgi:hypothetical protein